MSSPLAPSCRGASSGSRARPAAHRGPTSPAPRPAMTSTACQHDQGALRRWHACINSVWRLRSAVPSSPHLTVGAAHTHVTHTHVEHIVAMARPGLGQHRGSALTFQKAEGAIGVPLTPSRTEQRMHPQPGRGGRATVARYTWRADSGTVAGSGQGNSSHAFVGGHHNEQLSNP